MVITTGTTRIAEVAARFTLDAMPGKQMAIEADLNAGLIDEDEATLRRNNLRREADFYGAMDGAGKFVQGDVTAGLYITFINLVGGILIGVLQKGMDWGQALTTFSLLTIVRRSGVHHSVHHHFGGGGHDRVPRGGRGQDGRGIPGPVVL